MASRQVYLPGKPMVFINDKGMVSIGLRPGPAVTAEEAARILGVPKEILHK